MSPAARRTTQVVRRTQRQPTNWARFVAPTYTTVAAGTKVFLVAVVLSNPGINETIRRTRGIVSIASDQGAAQEYQGGAFGAIVVNDLAAAAGAASIPGPVTDANDDGWFVWRPFTQMVAENVTAGLQTWQYEFDSKAMRRVQEGFQIAFMIENASGTEGLQVAFALSLLTSLS